MKKIFTLSILVFLSSLIIIGCKKENSPEQNNNTNTGFANLPEAFTKKVLLEEYTGEWCVNCPDGALYIKNILAKNPGKVISVGVHQGDWLEIPQLKLLSTHLGGIAGYPRASLNRVPAVGTSNGQDGMVVYSRGNWETNAIRLIDGTTKTGKIGLALETKLTGDKLSIIAHCGYKETLTKDTRLTIYILEDAITAINQIGATTSPYIHEHTLKQVVTEGLGDAIDMKTGSYLRKEYNNISLTGMNLKNVKVVAFINTIGSTTNAHEVLNVQEVSAGETKSYD